MNLKLLLSLITILTIGSCNTHKEASKDVSNNQEVTIAKEVSWDNKVQVLLDSPSDYKTLEKKYERYSLTMLYPVSKSQEKYMFSFDTETISKKELLRILNKQVYVQSARDSKPLNSKNKRSDTSSQKTRMNVSKTTR